MTRAKCSALLFALILASASSSFGFEGKPVPVQVNWQKVVRVSNTEATLLVLATPHLRRGSTFHDRAFEEMKQLGSNYLRFDPWQAYPHLGVPELDPPTSGKTSWDFSVIDPVMEDVMAAAAGHSIVLNFSTIPQWMFKTPSPAPYPADPNQLTWDYAKGRDFRDPSFREVADYFARIVSWYANGGFTDELGKRHESGHHYKIDYWEVLNEPALERDIDIQTYTRLYDAVVTAIHKASPNTKFVGIVSNYPAGQPEVFQYFLDHKNHKPGVPLDMISYHFYAVPGTDHTPEIQQFTFFDQADRFLEIVGYIESIRKHLSPKTGTMVNEIGTMMGDDWSQDKPGYVFKPVEPSYWSRSAAVYAYVFIGLARMGIDDAGASMVPAFPGLFPSIAMLDWDSGEPNVRWRVLRLIHDNFAPGDKLVETPGGSEFVTMQGFVTRSGERKLLLVNRRDRDFEFQLPQGAGAKLEFVDKSTGSNPPATMHLADETLKIGPFGVAVVTLR